MNGSITLFGDKKPTPTPGMMPQNPIQEIPVLQRRLKMVEEAINNLRKQEQLNEQNTIAINKRVTDQLKEFQEEIRSIQHTVDKMKTDVQMIIAELQACAKSEDLTMLKKYINMLNPLHFVTQNEVENLIEEKVRQALSRQQ